MPRADGIKYDCLSFSRLVHIHRNTPMRGTKKAMTLRIMLPWVASSVKSALHTGQVFDSLGIIAPQYSHFLKFVLIDHPHSLFLQYQHSYFALCMIEAYI